MVTVRRVVGLAAALIACATPSGQEQFSAWRQQHPEAAKDFDVWVAAHGAAAHDIFAWSTRHRVQQQSTDSDLTHDEPVYELITWAVGAPGLSVDVFLMAHPDWVRLNDLILRHRVGVEAFLAWCRRYPSAAQELMDQSLGAQWVASHSAPHPLP